MSDVNVNLAIRVIAGDVNAWLPVIAPITCGQVMIQNPDATNAVKLRTDPADPLTQRSLAASAEVIFRASGPSAWGPNTTVLYFQPAAADLPLVATFVR